MRKDLRNGKKEITFSFLCDSVQTFACFFKTFFESVSPPKSIPKSHFLQSSQKDRESEIGIIEFPIKDVEGTNLPSAFILTTKANGSERKGGGNQFGESSKKAVMETTPPHCSCQNSFFENCEFRVQRPASCSSHNLEWVPIASIPPLLAAVVADRGLNPPKKNCLFWGNSADLRYSRQWAP